MIKIYNTLTRKKEEFETLEPGIVKMYVCGVTVYSDAHVGHAMSSIVFDIIRRYLEYRGYKVFHVMNFTDVDDRIITRANQQDTDPLIFAQRYINDYKQNLLDLNILQPTSTPQVSKTIPQIITFIQGLIDREYAYVAENNDVYFRVTKDIDYGRLSGRKLDDMQAGARIEVGAKKEHPMDFALWKAAKPGEIFWESPWGNGRPGWHIECSAMNLMELGEQIDIHGGGNDLIFPHHENEIAQTESYTGKLFARYWVHNGMLQFSGEKMSKSIGNIISIKEFLSKRDADVMRMLVLNGSYRAPLIFNEETLNSAQKGLERIKTGFKSAFPQAKGLSIGDISDLENKTRSIKDSFINEMDDDFNTAAALGNIFDFVRIINTVRDKGATSEQLSSAQDILREMTGILGLRINDKVVEGDVNQYINLLVEIRNEVRRLKLWGISDQIRDKLKEFGVTVEDSQDGSYWHW